MGCGASTAAVAAPEAGVPCSIAEMHARYKKKELLGRGAFGECHLAEDRLIPNRMVAVKSIFKSNKRFKKRLLENEIANMGKVVHDRIVRLESAHNTPEVAFLVLELVTGGDLLQRCIDVGRLGAKTVARVSMQVLDALEHLHSMDIAHRDVKPENVLLVSKDPASEQYWDIKLTDFGLSVKRDNVLDNVLKTLHGTPEFVAPEVLALARDSSRPLYSAKVDIWSVGTLAYVMLSATTPFKANGNLPEMITKIIKGDYSTTGRRFKGVSPVAIDFVKTCMTVDPTKRPTASEAMAHALLSYEDPPTQASKSSTVDAFNTVLDAAGADQGASYTNAVAGMRGGSSSGLQRHFMGVSLDGSVLHRAHSQANSQHADPGGAAHHQSGHGWSRPPSSRHTPRLESCSRPSSSLHPTPAGGNPRASPGLSHNHLDLEHPLAMPPSQPPSQPSSSGSAASRQNTSVHVSAEAGSPFDAAGCSPSSPGTDSDYLNHRLGGAHFSHAAWRSAWRSATALTPSGSEDASTRPHVQAGSGGSSPVATCLNRPALSASEDSFGRNSKGTGHSTPLSARSTVASHTPTVHKSLSPLHRSHLDLVGNESGSGIVSLAIDCPEEDPRHMSMSGGPMSGDASQAKRTPGGSRRSKPPLPPSHPQQIGLL